MKGRLCSNSPPVYGGSGPKDRRGHAPSTTSWSPSPVNGGGNPVDARILLSEQPLSPSSLRKQGPSFVIPSCRPCANQPPSSPPRRLCAGLHCFSAVLGPCFRRDDVGYSCIFKDLPWTITLPARADVNCLRKSTTPTAGAAWRAGRPAGCRTAQHRRHGRAPHRGRSPSRGRRPPGSCCAPRPAGRTA